MPGGFNHSVEFGAVLVASIKVSGEITRWSGTIDISPRFILPRRDLLHACDSALTEPQRTFGDDQAVWLPCRGRIPARRALEKRATEKREAVYQRTPLSYSNILKPGMSRKGMEDYFHSRNIVFQQMCCVDPNTFSKGVYDDL